MGRCCSQADLVNNISDTSLETRWFPWALCLRKTYRLVIFHVHDWDWLRIASLPCSPAWTLPKVRHHRGRNPTVLAVSFGPGCHLSCGTMTWLLSYCLCCSAQGLLMETHGQRGRRGEVSGAAENGEAQFP